MSPSSTIRVVPAAGPAARGVGKYRYIAMLAEGGMADVYLAVTRGAGFEKLVVIKQLRADLAADPSFEAMFMNEAGLGARLNHPNVVQTHEVGNDAGVHFLAMEFLEGVPYVRLARLRERIPPPLAFHVRILVDALHGLHYAHELRDYAGQPLDVVHRDVSPHNVMLTFAGGVKVLDFGIAKAALAAEQRPDDFKGKLEYMAPEQARLEPLDRRADVFSVGIMLWEALTRRRLYSPGDDKYERLITGNLPSVLSVRPDAPRKLAAICARAMSHDPRGRYATALEMANDLEEWLDGTTQRVSARDVGGYVSEKFATTRARLAEAIEAQLTVFRSLPEGATPSAMLARIPHTEVPISMPSDPPYAPGGPFGYAPEASWTGTGPTHWTREPPPPSASGPWPSPPVQAPSSRSAALTPVLLVAVAAVLVGGLAMYRFGATRSLGASTGVTATATPPPSEAPPETAAREIAFTVRATPADARISIDGEAMTANPASGKRARDIAMHVVRVEAPGFEPKEEQVAFDRSLFMTVDLRPVATPAATTEELSAREPPSAQPSASAAATSTSRPPAHRPRWRPPPARHGHAAPGTPGAALDTENPYQ